MRAGQQLCDAAAQEKTNKKGKKEDERRSEKEQKLFKCQLSADLHLHLARPLAKEPAAAPAPQLPVQSKAAAATAAIASKQHPLVCQLLARCQTRPDASLLLLLLCWLEIVLEERKSTRASHS